MFTRPRRWLAVIGALAIAGSVLVSTPQPAEAANPVDFDPGYIISDAQFYNASAMNEGQIQNFMRGMLPGCAQANGVPCLPNYVESTVTRAATTRCAVYEGAASEPASRIINKVAKACGINPQVLLATLQKENGLVTKQSPTTGAYRTAMGYACPDTAACDAAYFGFFNQVYSAASQFIRYGVNPSSWRYHPGAVSVQYHPNAACGSTVVNIQNKATAALYNYTPYQPNAAAMANLGGTGDVCSSYGNRNFWVYFSDWFGSPTGKINPFGAVDVVVGVVGGVYVQGWAIDPDVPASIPVHVYVDGVGVAISADQSRPDVGALYPSSGAAHGFSATVPVTSGGNHTVCIYGINQGPGANALFGCYGATTRSGTPVGVVDGISVAPNSVSIAGWAFDPDVADPIQVGINIDGNGPVVRADGARPDVAAAYPGYGAGHGYSATVTTTPGLHTVCATALNVGPGVHVDLLCRQVTVPAPAGVIPDLARPPFGAVDSITTGTGVISASGWTIDPDTAEPISVGLNVDGNGPVSVSNGARPDVAAVYPGYGPNHGFTVSVAAAPGRHHVCLTALNQGAGAHVDLACRYVTVPGTVTPTDQGRAPFGVVDAFSTTAGNVSVAGWTIDPDTIEPISVRVNVDGNGPVFLANGIRDDVAAAYPGYGSPHGYTASVPVAPGSHEICVTALNQGSGIHVDLGCRRLTVG